MLKLISFILFVSCVFNINAQEYRSVKIDAIESLLSDESDSLYVINFWATWCQPCVEEIPYFEDLTEKYADEKVKVILVSLDFKKVIESRLIPFLEKEKLKSVIWHLDETKANDYIPKVSEMWSGAIPFTVISRGSDKLKNIKEGKFGSVELDELISSFVTKAIKN